MGLLHVIGRARCLLGMWVFQADVLARHSVRIQIVPPGFRMLLAGAKRMVARHAQCPLVPASALESLPLRPCSELSRARVLPVVVSGWSRISSFHGSRFAAWAPMSLLSPLFSAACRR